MASTLSALAILSAQVLFVGESHEDHASKRHYPTLIEAVHRIDPRYDCVVFEVPEDLSIGDFGGTEWEQARLKMESLGGKSFAIDQNSKIRERKGLEYATHPVGMRARNRVMASKIKKLLRQGSCQKVIGFFGRYHVSHPENESLWDKNVKRIQEFMKRVPSMTIDANDLKKELPRHFTPPAE